MGNNAEISNVCCVHLQILNNVSADSDCLSPKAIRAPTGIPPLKDEQDNRKSFEAKEIWLCVLPSDIGSMVLRQTGEFQ
jgi:hypothetical protein